MILLSVGAALRISLKFVFIVICLSSLSGCASSVMVQPQVNSLVVAGKFNHALKILEEQKDQSYGKTNELLYYLDYGMVLHLSKRYEESIKALEQAKKVYDNLYTASLTNRSTTWLINDNTAPFRAEDFERVMINVIQSLNFVALGDVEEALVEARDVDSKLSLINQQYSSDQKNVYKSDAFARLLMGILYEINATNQDFNDAFIAYKKAIQIYEQDYLSFYKVDMPLILKENMLTVSSWLDNREHKNYKNKFRKINFLNLKEKRKKAEVFLFHYDGLSPVKHDSSLPIPLPDGRIARLAFPKYDKRFADEKKVILEAVDSDKNKFRQETEVVQDISAIAVLNLENRKMRVIAKSTLRSAAKYLFAQMQEDNIRDSAGDNSADLFKYLSNLYNVASEQPDLRSWQTLPAEVRLARLLLDPGMYTISFHKNKFKNVNLKAGQKYFYFVRTIN